LESGFQGAGNAGRPLLLEGGLDWKSMSMSPKDLDFMEAKHGAAREIALALGVPPMLLGIPGDNTFSNYQEANRTFWRQKVLPLVQRTADAFSEWLTSNASGELRFAADLDDIAALNDERDALWARLEKTSFLSNDEKREAVGYGPQGSASVLAAQPGGAKRSRVQFDHKYPGQPRTTQGRFDFGQQEGDVVPVARRPPIPTTPPSPKANTKTPKAGASGAEAAKDVPSWAKGERPFVGEDGKAFAKRLLDTKYGPGKWDSGPTSEFNRIQKFGDRGFD
jgi:hypothetical protein